MNGWHYAKSGMRLGPFSLEQMRELAKSGLLSATDMVLPEESQRWLPASEALEFLAPVALPASPEVEIELPAAPPSELCLIEDDKIRAQSLSQKTSQGQPGIANWTGRIKALAVGVVLAAVALVGFAGKGVKKGVKELGPAAAAYSRNQKTNRQQSGLLPNLPRAIGSTAKVNEKPLTDRAVRAALDMRNAGEAVDNAEQRNAPAQELIPLYIDMANKCDAYVVISAETMARLPPGDARTLLEKEAKDLRALAMDLRNEAERLRQEIK